MVVATVAVAAALALAAASSLSAAPSKSGCSPAQTRALINRFVTAFNLGDRRALNGTWASKIWFKWYSVTTDPGARTPEAAARRDTLLSYFAVRHAAHERLTLTDVKINGVSGGGYRNFEFHLMRSADDLPAGPVAYKGKGASTCSTGRLIAWVMGVAQ
jgi:hypothetical protein